MRRPLSIHRRLLLAALTTALAALTMTGWVLQREIVHVISENLSAKIDAQLGMIEHAVDRNGRFRPDRLLVVADLELPGAGWGWRLRTPAGQWRGGAQFGTTTLWDGFLEERAGAFNTRAQTLDGRPLYGRVRRRPTGTVEVVVPMDMLNTTLRPAMRKMFAALTGLAIVLVAATLLQLRFGLKPLHALLRDLASVRNGEATSVRTAQPKELLPLAEEVNALVAQNAAGLAHARKHVANLAHGLKTPLATLALTLNRDGEEARTRARTLVADLDQRIDHHLGRARAAAIGMGERARCDVAAVSAALLPVMRQLHSGRGISIGGTLVSMSVGVDRQDLDEMLGNLLDNACRHAHAQVRLAAVPKIGFVHLIVEDDGPGIPAEALVSALHAGTRLDERGKGYGFGLGIVQELSELYGGSLDLGRSPDLTGLRATLALPYVRTLLG